MKRISSVILMLLAGVSLFAETVNEKQARAIASEFFAQSTVTKAAKTNLSLGVVGKQVDQRAPIAPSEDPIYYLYNRSEGGFIVVAADNSVEPILAYSFEGSIDPDNMVPPMKWWLNEVLGGAIVAKRATGDNAPVTDGGIRKAGKSVVQYTTANWNQGAPYNGESPTIDGNKCITGCVATAAAIKARFHKWPYKGSGKVPSYNYASEDAGHNVTIPANQLGRVYDYDQMPLNYSGGTSAQQNAQVAALMYDMGCVSKMMFGWKGSGTYTSTLANGLKTYMHYSKNLVYASKSGSDWISRLEKELREVGPIIYDGHSPSEGGHCFIFDGYTEDHYMHVNWGWGGAQNTFVLVESPYTNFTFNQGQGAILNCIPDHSGIYTPAEIAASMTLTCLKTPGKVTLTHKSDSEFSVEYTLKDANDKQIGKGTLAPGAKYEPDYSKLAGEYILELKVVDYPDTIYTLNLEF